MHSQNLLAIFAKWPVAGQVKTRLAAATSPEFAAGLAEAMLRDTLAKSRMLDCERVIVFAPPEACDAFETIAGDGYRLTPQRGGNLGARLEGFLAQEVTGSNRVVILGADSPTMPVEYIADAWEALSRCDVVLGPASDGGYYLLGCTGKSPPIFAGIEWSGPRVLEQTVERVEAAGLRLSLLPPWYDVDTLEDLQVMRGHLKALRRAGVPSPAPATEEFWTSAARRIVIASPRSPT